MSFPQFYQYKKGSLHFCGKNLAQLHNKVKTPFYLYSLKGIKQEYTRFLQAAKTFGIKKPLVCYAVKANSNEQILNHLQKLGSGADVVSMGELKKCIKASIDPKKIVFSGIGKTPEELAFALSKNILSFNIESLAELKTLNQIAKRKKTIAPIALRLNPEVEAKTHRHISTGGTFHKFGLDLKVANNILTNLKEFPHCKLVGLSVHIGSQLTRMDETIQGLKKVLEIIETYNLNLDFIDVGGGLGIPYHPDDRKSICSLNDYMHAISQTLAVSHRFKRVIFEPGRFLVAHSGLLMCKVLRTKGIPPASFTIVDGGMNDLIRPVLYDAYHEILPLNQKNEEKKIETHIVGPICESTDCFAKDRALPVMQEGDWLAIMESGAYGRSMSSTYNERPLPKEYFLEELF